MWVYKSLSKIPICVINMNLMFQLAFLLWIYPTKHGKTNAQLFIIASVDILTSLKRYFNKKDFHLYPWSHVLATGNSIIQQKNEEARTSIAKPLYNFGHILQPIWASIFFSKK